MGKPLFLSKKKRKKIKVIYCFKVHYVLSKRRGRGREKEKERATKTKNNKTRVKQQLNNVSKK